MTPKPLPTLVACAHGTRDAGGVAAVRALVEAVRGARPSLSVRVAFVDVQSPTLESVVGETEGAAVVVPLLLAAGYHVHVDLAGAIAARADVTRSAVLGRNRTILEIMLSRVREVGAVPGDHNVWASAGSSDARARTEIQAAARAFGQLWGAPARVGYVAGSVPSVADEVADVRTQSRWSPGSSRVVVASHLLTPGTFWHRLHGSGADLVSAPLLTAAEPDPRLVRLILRRFAEATSHQADLSRAM